MKKIYWYPVLLAGLTTVFLTAVSNLEKGHALEGKEQLEEVLRKASAACYASEGCYPPDLNYLKENYGIQINEEKYTVIYEVIASNLMPDITVLEVAR